MAQLNPHPPDFALGVYRIQAKRVKKFPHLIFPGISKGASRPTLGLSNKAVNENIETKAANSQFDYPDHYFVETRLTEPPTEETLLQNTLWPETQKLYGHEGYEIFALAASHDGKLLASACKAASVDHAQVLIWSCESWKFTQKLASHQLTVTQMEFSPDNRYLLSVSRDRRWTLFENGGEAGFKVVSTTDKSTGIHARIIWCCSWTFDSKLFATGSRDGKVVAWNPGATTAQALAVLETKQDVTAISFLQRPFENDAYLAALGLGSGQIWFYKLQDAQSWHKLMESNAHHLTIKRLRFRPGADELASCGDDHFVKIFRLKF